MSQTLTEFLVQPTCYCDPHEVQAFLKWKLAQERVSLEQKKGVALLTQLSRELYPALDRDHGWPHIAAVLHHMDMLTQMYQVSDNEYYALCFAALLHDSVRYNHHSPAVASAIFTQDLLKPYVQSATLDLALDAIIQHSSGTRARYKHTHTTRLLYDADKSDTNRVRWSQWGLNPNKIEQTTIELEYQLYLDLVLGTLSTYYSFDILQKRLHELELLRQK